MAQINWQPLPGKWSIGQHIGHLNLVGYESVLDLVRSVNTAGGLKSPGPYRYSRIWQFLIRLTEPPPRIRFRAPRQTLPPDRAELVEIVKFVRLQDALQSVIRQADGLDLGRVKVCFPAARWLSISLGQCLALLAAHERRHLWHCWNVRNDSNFPQA